MRKNFVIFYPLLGRLSKNETGSIMIWFGLIIAPNVPCR
jgi:hypothetical protein